MNRTGHGERCPRVAHDWPTITRRDGEVIHATPVDPTNCRGVYHLPPVTCRPGGDDDPDGWPTEHPCPFDDPRRCPHWDGRMERIGASLGVPPRSREATLEDIPEDIADGVIAYLRSIEDNVRDGLNVIIAGAVGAGKTCLAGLLLVTHARLTGIEEAGLIGAEELFGVLEHLPTHRGWRTDGGWSGLIDAPLLVIDDLGTEFPTSAAVRNWNRLVDARHQETRATIVTTNSDDLDGIFHDERTRSRFMANCVVWRTARGDVRGAAAAVGYPPHTNRSSSLHCGHSAQSLPHPCKPHFPACTGYSQVTHAVMPGSGERPLVMPTSATETVSWPSVRVGMASPSRGPLGQPRVAAGHPRVASG